MSRDEFITLKQTLAAMRRGKQEVAPDFIFTSPDPAAQTTNPATEPGPPVEMPAGAREMAHRKRLVEDINWKN